MSADIISCDFRGKTWTKDKQKIEPPIDFAAIESEICAALWNQDAGTIGQADYNAHRSAQYAAIPPDYDPRKT